MTLGERISSYQTQANMSQDVLAEKIGVTRQTISKWETDQSTPEFNKILPLCEIFGITTDEFIKGEKVSTPTSSKEDNEQAIRKRHKQKAFIVCISVFLYCIGTFSLPYMTESLEYEVSHALMITTTLWSVATVILLYYFISRPKEKKKNINTFHSIETTSEDTIYTEKIKETIEETQNKKKKQKTKQKIMGILALLFLLLYFFVSFMSMAWNVTWMIWIVLAIAEIITSLLLDIKGEQKCNIKD